MKFFFFIVSLFFVFQVFADVPVVKLIDAAKLISEKLSSEDAKKAKAGEVSQIASLEESKDLKVAKEGLTKSISAKSLSIIDTIETTNDFAFTVENKAGARAIISVNKSGGVIYIVPKPNSTKMTGACQKIPEKEFKIDVHTSAINQKGDFNENTISWRLSTTRLFDVDGDAILDALVPVYQKGDCPEQGFWEVYVMRGSCGYDLGQVGPGLYPVQSILSPLDTSGFRPLSLESTSSRPNAKGVKELIRTTTIFNVDKGVYTKKTETSNAGACQHCASWYCTSN